MLPCTIVHIQYLNLLPSSYWYFNFVIILYCLYYRVIELEKKREKIALATENMNNMEIKNEPDEIEESDGSDMDEFIDWRSKK